LVGLSAPPSLTEEGKANFKQASWGRYIPQVGDMMLVAFGANMELYALGYTAVFYPGFDIADEQNETTGGIGWGDISAKEMKPGDWDFKSARNASLYLGEKAKIASGTCSSTYNQSTQDITNTATLHMDKSGSSTRLFGAVRRFLLPTDSEETYVPSGRGITYAQEHTTSVKWDGIPGGAELARLSMGDVMDDSIPSVMLKLSTFGQPTRRHFSANDFSGLVPVYDEITDCLGNYEVLSVTGTNFMWTTALASWNITNLNTTLNSSAAISLTSGAAMTLNSGAALSLTSTGNTVITAPVTQIGSAAASSPAVKGTEYLAAFNAFLTAVVSATAVVGTAPQNATALTAIGAAATALQSLIGNTVSSKVLVE